MSEGDRVHDPIDPAFPYGGMFLLLEPFMRTSATRIPPAMGPSAWELAQRFAGLHQTMTIYFGQDGIAYDHPLAAHPDAEDADLVAAMVADHHRQLMCSWRFPQLVAQCAEALAVFTDDDSLARFFAGELHTAYCASWTEWITLLRDSLTDHLRHEHGPVGWTGGRAQRQATRTNHGT
ncbi:hypothetical protein [Yinghuangia soli]|uniref:Uncharacterized protein n=1 Tax=Yinghuangia soli TaxID=2908204 RepID=A0AA41PWF5_9ACTN|nr:hypothetical protein [Yinghuangia soli]MCF2526968.1 hypothetical protein [Yinghuangia soli]